MMDNMLVIIFDSEIKALEGSRSLQKLQEEGSINLYSKAVISRDGSGKVEVKQKGDMGPVGTAVGLLTGSLIGMLGGPVGLVLGTYVGTASGLLYDMAQIGVGQDFLTEVERTMQPGKSAVVAEVGEDWTLPVDTSMEALGGVVIRRTRREFLDSQIKRDASALDADLANLKAERDQVTGEARVKLQKKVDSAKSRLQTMQDDIQAKIEASKQETEAKIKSLQEQTAKESGELKALREKRIADLQADQERRSDQLKQAWEQIKKTLSN
jgi:uncharacterized membrane protein